MNNLERVMRRLRSDGIAIRTFFSQLWKRLVGETIVFQSRSVDEGDSFYDPTSRTMLKITRIDRPVHPVNKTRIATIKPGKGA